MKNRRVPRRAALYHRVSTVEQDPTLAREDLRAAARNRGLDVVLEVEEVGSGARNDRPGLARVLDAARRGRVDVVLVWKLDRFGRSALDLLHNVRQLADAGVGFLAVTQGIDVAPDGGPMATLMLTLLAGVAEFERDLIRERTRLGLAAARRRGVVLGRPRTGPAFLDVATARQGGLSWPDVGRRLGCDPDTARTVWRRGAGQKGHFDRAPATDQSATGSPALSRGPI